MSINSTVLSSDMITRLRQIKSAAEFVYGAGSVMSQIAIAQVQQESGIINGASELAKKYNNLFGIKGKGTAGSVKVKTFEYENGKKFYIFDDFAKNLTLEDSFAQHKKLMQHPRYSKVLAAKTFKEAAEALKEAGYATDPDYPKNLLAAFKAVKNRW